ncbi:TatD family nuclease-associated radical SAM protein [Oxalobacter vibrioformis]|uniref:TatD family nuclease-associated radical SAM protein n=1 Tax=Oxalobacter vibrioformis TaxID=933080 RepID=A0A9E9P3Q0_9BURK|nr:TatD family nuclease-associated radical SAM protein [Oxalobacter vibrioformis]WAW11219.1 TatD family nuclease-associated radical SAM protein [Oxalobacter vibrioformis]
MTDVAIKPEEVIGYTIRNNRYLNVTNRCSLRCRFCPKFNGEWSVREYNMRLRYEPTVEELIEAAGNPADYDEIVFCGMGETTMRLDVLLEVARALREKGARLRLNTSGVANIVHGRDVAPELARYIQSMSVSLNAQNEEVYNRHCNPKLPGTYASMLEFIKSAKAAGADVTVTAVDGLPGVDIAACAGIANDLGVKFRRRVLDDLG